jgi:hypothetical protein
VAAAEVAKVEQQRQKQISGLTAENAELKGQYNSQVAECEKGKIAYDKLTVVIKNQTPAPVCGKTL